ITEVLYKIAGMYVLQLVNMTKVFPSIQLGCGVRGGPERAVHVIRSGIQSGDSVLASLDFRNAFNARRRHRIATELYANEDTSSCWKLFDCAYRSPSALIVYDGMHLKDLYGSCEGVR